ncbi:hypothetical protein QJS66_15185 [Kocuria rhizophila]|nr:hypothetical protein QJS66_15185 [Kocuria rhizophila]
MGVPVLAQIPHGRRLRLRPRPVLFLWVLIITMLDALAMGKPTGPGLTAALPAGWWWLLFILLMGWLGFARGGRGHRSDRADRLGPRRRPSASAVLSVATWIKVWPAAVVLALLSAARRRGAARRRPGGAGAAGVAAASGSVEHRASPAGLPGMQPRSASTPPGRLSVLHIGDSHEHEHGHQLTQVDGPART